MILPETLGLLKKAEVDGYDGAVIGCFYDPGLREARELFGPDAGHGPGRGGHAHRHHSGQLLFGDRGPQEVDPQDARKRGPVRLQGPLRLLQVRWTWASTTFQKDPHETERRLKQAAIEAIEKDGAEVILLGCTLEFGFFSELQKEIQVPVIDAVVAPVKYLELLMEIHQAQGWTQSKAYGYESPPQEELSGMEPGQGLEIVKFMGNLLAKGSPITPAPHRFHQARLG